MWAPYDFWNEGGRYEKPESNKGKWHVYKGRLHYGAARYINRPVAERIEPVRPCLKASRHVDYGVHAPLENAARW